MRMLAQFLLYRQGYYQKFFAKNFSFTHPFNVGDLHAQLISLGINPDPWQNDFSIIFGE